MASEGIGQLIALIIPPEMWGEEESILARLGRGERIEHYESVRLTKDGRRIDVSLTISPIRNSSGRIVEASKVARDVTARKAAERETARLQAELREADRRKDDFLATLSHELRNPLAPISHSLQLLRLSGELSPSADRIRETMDDQVKQLVRLVDDLLDMSRITSGTIKLSKERVDVAAIVAHAVETSRPLIDAAGHQLALTLPAEPLWLEVDPVRIAQVLANLLNNAAKYMDGGGQIWLSARRVDHGALISVRDAGVGIPADMLPRIFDMFSQVDRTLNRARGGLGIGLALARQFVELHGGRIEAHSTGPGQGSELVIHLPGAAAEPPAARMAPPTCGRTNLSRRRVFVVDDMRSAGHVLARLLEVMGQQVRVFPDPAQVCEAARVERPDVVFSDIGMPGMDGYELARQLRADPSLEGLCLVAMTGYGQDGDCRRAQAAGFDHHLVKPASYQALVELLALLPVLEHSRSSSGVHPVENYTPDLASSHPGRPRP